MKSKVYKILKSSGGYVSGEQISGALGITRAAVWKHINAIKADGAIIESVNNRGYRLVSLPTNLKPEYLENMDIVWLESVDSTNNYAKLNAHKFMNPTVICAKKQSKGRGRIGRGWDSRPGNIYCTFILRPEISPQYAQGMSIMFALAACETLGENFKIKWPNDIVIDGKKIVGILPEMSADIDRVEYVIAGIGINIKTPFEGELSDKAVSYDKYSNKPILDVFQSLIDNINKRYEQFLKEGVEGMMGDYVANSAIIGKQIRAERKDGSITGTCTGFDEFGNIKILGDDGQSYLFNSGEISVRGLMGYI